MIRIAVAALALAAVVALGSLPGPVTAAPATPRSTYIPRAPQTDTLLYPPLKKDKRIVPGHPFPMGMDDPHVPSRAHSIWHNQDYFTIPYVAEATRLIPIVENGHLGLKTNPRGFWPYFYARRYVDAIAELNYVLGVFNNHPRALHLLGICAKALNQPDIPIAYYEKALRWYPRHAITRAQYGTYLVDIGEITWGMRELNAALALDPDQPLALASLERAKRELATAQNTGAVATPPDSLEAPRR